VGALSFSPNRINTLTKPDGICVWSATSAAPANPAHHRVNAR